MTTATPRTAHVVIDRQRLQALMQREQQKVASL
jgi:hypothetical protein